MKKVLLIILIMCGLLAISGCDSSNKISTTKKAKLLDWENVHKEISSNGAKATDYNNKWYIFSGVVGGIKEKYCKMFTEIDSNGRSLNEIYVYLKTEELKKINSFQTMSVVGKFKYVGNSAYLEKAFVFPKELYNDEHFIIDLLSSQDGTNTPHFFSEYEYDSNGNKTHYIEKSYVTNASGSKHEEQIDRYTLKYNDKNQLISEMKNGKKETKYTYNEDGFVSTMTVPSIYKGEDYTIFEYTYEKDKNGKVIKGIKKNNRVEDKTYEYDKNGKVLKETSSKSTYIYTYDGERLINKKLFYDNSEKELENINYYYGVVGIK